MKKILHIFQFRHNPHIIRAIKAGRFLQKREIFQPIFLFFSYLTFNSIFSCLFEVEAKHYHLCACFLHAIRVLEQTLVAQLLGVLCVKGVA